MKLTNSNMSAEYHLSPVTERLPGFLKALRNYPEVITDIPQADPGRLPRSYISRIGFFPIGNPTDFDTLSEFLLMDYLDETARVWTAHKSVRKGDLVFFVLADSAHKGLRDAKKQFDLNGIKFPEPWNDLLDWSKRNRKKLIAWSYYLDKPSELAGATRTKWKQQAPFGKVQFLKEPLAITELDYHAHLTAREEIVGGAGTDMNPHRYMSTASFNILREAILLKDPNTALKNIPVAAFGHQAEIGSSNWIDKIHTYDDFWAECHVREIFVDELLRRISDDKEFHPECAISRKGEKTGKFVDYVILVNGRWLPVEVKYNIHAVMQHLEKQVLEYVLCHAALKNGEIVDIGGSQILVIDRDSVWLWNGADRKDLIINRKEISESTLRNAHQKILSLLTHE